MDAQRVTAQRGRRRIPLRATAAGVLAGAALLAAVPDARAVEPCRITVAGDSITARSASELEAALGAGTCVYGRPLRTSSVIVDAMLAKARLTVASTWVFAAGTNDALNGGAASSVARSMRKVQTAAEQRGVQVYWVDTYVDRYSALGRSRAVNQRITEVAAASNGRIRVVPWAAFLDEDPVRPLAYLVDGVHTTAEGSAVRSRLISVAVTGESEVASVRARPQLSFTLNAKSGDYGASVPGRVQVTGATESSRASRVLLVQPGDRRDTVQWVTLNAQGQWAGRVRLRASGPIRAFLPGSLTDDEASASTSLSVRSRVKARVVHRRSGTYVVATAMPASGAPVALQRSVNGRWRTVASAPSGRSAIWRVVPGFTYRVWVPSTALLRSAASAPVRA